MKQKSKPTKAEIKASGKTFSDLLGTPAVQMKKNLKPNTTLGGIRG